MLSVPAVAKARQLNSFDLCGKKSHHKISQDFVEKGKGISYAQLTEKYPES